MRVRELALEATERALAAFEEPGVRVGSLIRLCQRVAGLRNDVLGSAILHMETVDVTMPREGRIRYLFPERVEALSASLPRDEAHDALLKASEARLARMTMPSRTGEEPRVWGSSVASLENSISMLEDQIAVLDRNSESVAAIDLRLLLENEQIRSSLLVDLQDRRMLLERVRSFLFDYLLEAEAELRGGQTYAGSFENTIRYVDETLADLAPSAAAELSAAQPRVAEATSASLAQALVSCRRALKGLADALYAARTEPVVGLDGKARNVGENNYINRLIQFAVEQIGPTSSVELLRNGLDSLGRRLNAINELDNKGVHGDVTREEADACLAQTYLLAAELLRLRDHRRTGPR